MIRCAILMDDIHCVDTSHDSSYLMGLAAQKKGWQLFYLQQQDLFFVDGKIKANAQALQFFKEDDYYKVDSKKTYDINHFDVILMRKDPPFNINYIYTTYFLELAAKEGVLVINNPQSLRDANEKMFALWFYDLMPKTVVSSDKDTIKTFWQKQGAIILKPLDGMGGQSIFYAAADEPNINVIIETLTKMGTTPIMVQQYIPAVKTEGDKRIIIVNGEAVDYALVRKPKADDIRGNMAAGGTIEVLPLTKNEQKICATIGPVLKQMGLVFVGLDLIGDKVTEINVTSPTGAQEIERATGIDIGERFINAVEQELRTRA